MQSIDALSETDNMFSRPKFYALFESATAVVPYLTVFAHLGFDHRGRESTLPRGPAVDDEDRGLYRLIQPPPSTAGRRVLSLDGFRSASCAETRLVDGFKVETNQPRNQVSSATHRDMGRRAMSLCYDFIRLQITVWVHISTLLNVICIQVT